MKTKMFLSILIFMGFFSTANAQHRFTNNHHERLRIAQGVRKGSLTRGEAMQLRVENARVNHYEKKTASDGVITPRERRKTKMMERRLNRQIFIKKHN
ncbi:MAG: hypothetical protein HYX40_07315 [Sphingobacteriales bacterium]|nr:hypothetical protein [Sphingobacteriales bacterium]